MIFLSLSLRSLNFIQSPTLKHFSQVSITLPRNMARQTHKNITFYIKLHQCKLNTTTHPSFTWRTKSNFTTQVNTLKDFTSSKSSQVRSRCWDNTTSIIMIILESFLKKSRKLWRIFNPRNDNSSMQRLRKK